MEYLQAEPDIHFSLTMSNMYRKNLVVSNAMETLYKSQMDKVGGGESFTKVKNELLVLCALLFVTWNSSFQKLLE